LFWSRRAHSFVEFLGLLFCSLYPEKAQQNSTLGSEFCYIYGFQIYKQHCVTCHGDNGKMGLNGAKPLPESKMTLEERITHISNGKGAMQPYKGILSPEEIKAVAEYTFQLK